jgi:hypothetical protein
LLSVDCPPPPQPVGKLDEKSGLEKDYDAMRAMIFGEVPQFARIIETLAGLEEEINHK